MSVNLSRRNSLKTIGAAFCVPFLWKWTFLRPRMLLKISRLLKMVKL